MQLIVIDIEIRAQFQRLSPENINLYLGMKNKTHFEKIYIKNNNCLYFAFIFSLYWKHYIYFIFIIRITWNKVEYNRIVLNSW